MALLDSGGFEVLPLTKTILNIKNKKSIPV
jgi:hypothetical protein